ncbi:CHAT domain-containing protein [Thiolapillus sp.]
MFRLILTVTLLLAIHACALVPDVSPEERLNRLQSKAREQEHLSHFVSARSYWQRALTLTRSQHMADKSGEILLGLARTDGKLGQNQQASSFAWKAFHDAQSKTDASFKARALIAIGQTARRIGEYQEAGEAYNEALKIARNTGNKTLEAQALCGLGSTRQALSDFSDALQFYERALAMGILPEKARCLNNLGGLYRQTGEYHKAIEHYSRSLALRKHQHDLDGQSKVLGNLCLVYQNLRDFEQAKSYCLRSLALARKTQDLGRQANNFNNLAAIAEVKGNFKQALSLYQKSLALKRKTGDRAGEARSLNNIGRLYQQRGYNSKALKYYRLSLHIKKALGDLSGQSASLQNLGILYLQLGQYDQALQHFEQALMLQQQIGQPEILWRSYNGMSRTYEKLDKPALAIFFGKQAVNIIQTLRGRILKLEAKLRRSFLQDKIQVYKRVATLLGDEGRLWEAQQVLAMVKQEEYFEFTRGQGNPQAETASFNVGENNWKQRYDQIVDRLAFIQKEYSKLKREQRQSESGLSAEKEEQLDRVKQLLGDLKLAHHQFILELQTDFTEGQRLDEFKGDNLRRLEKFQRTLKSLGEGTVLVHYFVTQDQLKIIVSGSRASTPPVWKQRDISRKELNRKIIELRNALLNPDRNPLPPAQSLYDELIAPIDDILRALDAKVLMVYLDDALRYLPLAALHDGQQYLAEKYGIAVYTAAADMDLVERPAPRWRIAGLGVTKPFISAGFSSLPAVAEELDAIVKEGSDDQRGILPGISYMDEAFTPRRLENILSEDCLKDDCYQVVHLATHYLFKPGSWSDSFLLTGNETLLTLEDLQRGDYYFGNLDLLTLSACETALWSDDSRGREIEGLGTLAQNKGARAVLATLWEVADCSTAVFMEQFYRNRQKNHTTKLEALRQTQLTFIHGKPTDTALPECTSRGVSKVPDTESPKDAYITSPSAPFSHPYYWAPFVLMGNWR